ncbi:hypothetical protein [Nostoc sp.]|uniref:hypothetical protein n=1 Tax=Nostoc sp. TaxID=1180 RepID=UPI002FFC3930
MSQRCRQVTRKQATGIPTLLKVRCGTSAGKVKAAYFPVLDLNRDSHKAVVWVLYTRLVR